jgi:hypothetical protein
LTLAREQDDQAASVDVDQKQRQQGRLAFESLEGAIVAGDIALLPVGQGILDQRIVEGIRWERLSCQS